MKFAVFGFAVLLLLFETTQRSTIEEAEIQNLISFAYQVSLRNAADNTHFCSGSIFSIRHILTAAHCVHHPHSGIKRNHREIRIVAAQLNLHITHRSYIENVSKIIVHPKYNNYTYDNDIAILQVSHELDFFDPYISRVKLRSSQMMSNCYVSGWGSTNYQAQHEMFTYVEVKIMSAFECQELYAKENIRIPNNVICTKTQNEVCLGDSGGPLLCDGVLAGVTSFCGYSGKPGVYTDLGPLRKWIHKIRKRRKHRINKNKQMHQ